MTKHKPVYYLNNSEALSMYKEAVSADYYVDKSNIIGEMIPNISTMFKHVCITRPRRFGKSTVASMLGAFFGKGCDSRYIFDELNISNYPDYEKHINQYNVIYIDFSAIEEGCESFDDFIGTLKQRLQSDVRNAFPDLEFGSDFSIRDDLRHVNIQAGEKFIFVLDEWDSVFQFDFITERDKKRYLLFLKTLLKGNAYAAFTYMTGIMPISQKSSGSALNMFYEYTMGTSELYSEYFGFTHEEVTMLYERYLKICSKPKLTLDGLQEWYDGYQRVSGKRLYNPRSVVAALKNNELGGYWTSSGPYDEIFYYVKNNIHDIKDDIAVLVAGKSVSADVRQYAATMHNLETKDEIISAMIVFGFLTVYEEKVSVPNKELMEKFVDMTKSRKELGYVYRLAKESERLLNATLEGDTEMMEQIFELAHDTETPLLAYNREEELSSLIRFMYLSARDDYRTEREDRAGKGFVDYIFYPKKKHKAAIVMEFKVNDTAENAIAQIKNKNYARKLQGKLGDVPEYSDKVLAVGIAYDKANKKHSCLVEEL